MGSFRNNALAALAELKPDLDARSFKVDYASFRTLSGALNYIQKVGFGVMTDFVTGRMSAMVVPARGASKSAIRNAKDPNIRWIHAQRVQILQLYDYTVEASKSVGEGLSNMVEDYLSPAKADAPDKTGVNKKK